jgi:hypothetical protein
MELGIVSNFEISAKEVIPAQQIVNLLLFQQVLNPKDKSKTVGVARQQRHFLCSDKENEAKENFALR